MLLRCRRFPFRKRLSDEFGIKFKEIDPKNDYFLGANRTTSDDRTSCKLSASTYIADMGKNFLPDVDVLKPSSVVQRVPCLVLLYARR